MRNRFSKLLSVFLCLSMLFSMSGFSVFAEDTATEQTDTASESEAGESTQLSDTVEYDDDGNPIIYVSFTGDDSTANGSKKLPYKTISAAITAINAFENITAATVKVSNANTPDNWTTPTNGGGYVAYHEASVTVKDDGTVSSTRIYNAAHSVTITYTTWDELGDGSHTIMPFVNYPGNANSDLVLAGPSVFKDIILADQRGDNYTRAIAFSGHDAVFDNVAHYHYTNSTGLFKKWAKTVIRLGTHTNATGTVPGAGTDFVISSVNVDGTAISALHYGSYLNTNTANNFYNITDDTSATIKGGTLASVVLNNTNTGKAAYMVYEKDLSLVLQNGAKVTAVSNTIHAPTVKGNIWFILNDGSSIGSITPVDDTQPIAYKDFTDFATERTTPATVYTVNVNTPDLVLGKKGTVEANNSENELIYYLSDSGEIAVFDRDVTQLTFPEGGGTYTVGTADSFEGLILIATDADGNIYWRELDAEGKYATALPEGAGNFVFHATKDDAAYDLKSKADYGTNSYPDIVFNADGTVSEVYTPKKQFVPISSFNATEYDGNNTYDYESTTLFGESVYRFYRASETDGEKFDNIVPYNHQKDMKNSDGENVKVGDFRYITVFYYYDVKEETEDTPFVGNTMQWNQYTTSGEYTTEAWQVKASDYATVNNTIVANKWAAITLDMFDDSKGNFKKIAFDNPDATPRQFKLWSLNQGGATLSEQLNYGDSFYIGNLMLTNYDPTEELAKKNIVFISANGNDENDGSSTVYPVKSFDRAYELIGEQESAKIIVLDDVTYDASTENGTSIVITSTTGATVTFTEETPLMSDVIISGITVAGTLSNGGHKLTVEAVTETAEGAEITAAAGGNIMLRDGNWASVNVKGDAAEEFVNINVDGAKIEYIELNGSRDVATINVSTDTVGEIKGEGAYNTLQVIVGDASFDFDNRFVNTNAGEGLDIILTLPKMKSPDGKAFEVTGTDRAGVFATYSGKAHNFGYGLTTYTAYAKNTDGTRVYYSNESTGYELEILESGAYQLEVAAEKNHTASNGKAITGFSTTANLTLPEGCKAWVDKGGYYEASDEVKKVYVSNYDGVDAEGRGLSRDLPVKTVKYAISNIIGTANDGTIYVMDKWGEEDSDGNLKVEIYTRWNDGTINGTNNVLVYDAPAHTGTITYEGIDGDSSAVICYGENSLDVKGPTVFKNITVIEGWKHYKPISLKAQSLTFGENVKFFKTELMTEARKEAAGGSELNAGVTINASVRQLALGSGYGNTTTTNNGELVIGDGKYDTVFIGSIAGDIIMNAPYTIRVNGGTVNSLVYGYNGKKIVADTLNILYNGGTIKSVADQSNLSSASSIKNLQIVFNNGLTPENYNDTSVAVTNKWFVKAEENGGAWIDVTDTEGTFTVVGGMYAKAVSEDGNTVVYSDSDGQLVLPAGNYSVTYQTNAPYELSVDEEAGTAKITAYEEITVALSDLPVPEIPGKLFYGWTLNGEAVSTSEIDFTNGVVLEASLVDFDTEYNGETGSYGDLSVIGAQMRFADEETGITQGLRFVTHFSTALRTALGIADHNRDDYDGAYGTLVIPTELLVGELDLDTSKAAQVEAYNLYEKKTDYYLYTAVITDITQEFYSREYTVRSYVKYTDLNGIERVAYGEPYALSLFEMASYISDNKADETKEKNLLAVEKVISDGRAYLDAPVTMIYDGTVKEGLTQEQAYATGKWTYKNADGVRMREIHLNGGTNANAKDTVVAVVTDTHINVVSEKDRYDPEIQYTNQTRSWVKNGRTIPNLRNAMGFADLYDITVVTGDIIDYLSYGALDVIKEELFIKHPEDIYVLGGHDVTKNMETGFKDAVPVETRRALLQEYYDTIGQNIDYSSKLVNNNVICVNLNNGLGFYYESQYEQLKADIELARENGYIVLIFQHEPMSTGYSEENYVVPFDIDSLTTEEAQENASTNINGSGVIGSVNAKNPAASTTAVYNLITSSADVVKGVFAGHWHNDMYTEIKATDKDGNETFIPQYINTANAYHTGGYVVKVVIDANPEAAE